MPDEQLANSDSARDATGTIVDQAGSGLGTETTTPQDQTQTSQTESTGTTTKTEGETLLTEGETKTEVAKAPDAYAEFKLPEGVKLDGEQLTAATALFKEANLSQDFAQKMVDFHVAELKKTAEAGGKAYDDMRADWQSKTKADPEIAKVRVGDKSGLDAVKINVGRVYNAIGDAALVTQFKEAMNLSGVGDHPAFVRVMNKLSEFVVEGKHVGGKGPSEHGQSNSGNAPKPTAAQAMYPNLPSSARS